MENKNGDSSDFRKVKGEKTVGDAYPLRNTNEILDQLGQPKQFSSVDMVMVYHQIKRKEQDEDKTTFSTKQGHWAYRSVPMGLKTARTIR
jgi:hypothetical protein